MIVLIAMMTGRTDPEQALFHDQATQRGQPSLSLPEFPT